MSSTTLVAKAPINKRALKRQMLIDIGTVIFTQKGFSITSLDEIVMTAEIPKGSFYYYFQNKEDFAIEVIKNYGRYFSRKLERILEDTHRSPLERLWAFAKEAIGGMTRFDFKRGCLIGNLGQEMATLQEDFRLSLLDVIQDWRIRIERCIEEAKHAGEINTTVSSQNLAIFFWSAWEGAVLCSKLERSAQPLKIVSDLFINEVLQPVVISEEGDVHV